MPLHPSIQNRLSGNRHDTSHNVIVPTCHPHHGWTFSLVIVFPPSPFYVEQMEDINVQLLLSETIQFLLVKFCFTFRHWTGILLFPFEHTCMY